MADRLPLINRTAAWIIGTLLTALASAAALPDLEPQLADSISAAARYQSGQSMEPLRDIEARIRGSAADPGLRKQLEAGLIQLLVSESTGEAKQFAAKHLATIGTEDSLPALAGLLQNDRTVALACQVLGTLPSARSNDILLHAVPMSRGPARVQIIETLATRSDAGSVALLTRLAMDPEAETARAAILGLGRIANEEACTAITRLQKENKPELAAVLVEASMSAAEKLAASGDVKRAQGIYEELLVATEPANVRRGAFDALLALDQDFGEQRILDALHGSDSLLKPVAIAAVRGLRSQTALAKVAQSLPDLETAEQVWLIEALAGSRDEASRIAVQRSLSSPELTVRLAAMEALGRYGDAASVRLLVDALRSISGAKEKAGAERALSGLPGGIEADKAILDEMSRAPDAVKISLLRVLVRREARSAFPGILNMTDEPGLAEPSFTALGSLAGSQDIPVLLETLVQLSVPSARSEAENAVAQALLKADDHALRASAVCGRLMATQQVETRCSLLRLLPTCDDPQALAALQVSVNDADPHVRDVAVRALADWPEESAWETLAEVLRGADGLSHHVVALSGLVRLLEEGNARPDSRLIARYRELLDRARSAEDRKLVLGALGGVSHPDALQLAIPLLGDSAVGPEAEACVRRVAEGLKRTHPKAATEALQKLRAQ
jgi:HEAT repeat protein